MIYNPDKKRLTTKWLNYTSSCLIFYLIHQETERMLHALLQSFEAKQSGHGNSTHRENLLGHANVDM